MLPVAVLAACTSTSTSTPSSNSPSGSGSAVAAAKGTGVGVKVSGGFGAAPRLSIPAKPAPAALTQQTLVQGSGAPVVKGDTLIANYLGQTWAPKAGKSSVFDSSFQRGSPAAFVIGTGAVIPGWDKTLVGKKLGSRMLLTVPPTDGYGPKGQPNAGISGTDTLVFVVDLVAEYSPNASAPGTAVTHLPKSGLPKVTNVPGKQPQIISTKAVKAPTRPTSTLLVTGHGPKIDTAKTLVLQLVQTDLATGKHTQSSWGRAPQTIAAKSVLGVADKLTGQRIGSRVLVLLPPSPARPASPTQAAQPPAPASVLIVDVVGQF
ncbi:MAG TPA: FKBP-type peptidyl-prolyl cis-trans isomerase [Jatrophihabitans sp.]